MTTQKKTENEATLKQLASSIQEGHRRVMSNVRDSIHQARINGQHLLDARTRVEHGYWKAWVRDNCKFSDRMALKYMNVARHYDALVDLFNTQDEWKLTEFFTLAAEMEAKAKLARDKKQGSGTGTAKKPAASDAFRLDRRERNKKVKELEKIKARGTPPVEKDEKVRGFIEEQCVRLVRAVKRFACSTEAKEVAAGFDTAMLGILLLEALKARIDAKDLFSAPDEADSTDATRPVAPHDRLGQHLNGNGKEKKSVA